MTEIAGQRGWGPSGSPKDLYYQNDSSEPSCALTPPSSSPPWAWVLKDFNQCSHQGPRGAGRPALSRSHLEKAEQPISASSLGLGSLPVPAERGWSFPSVLALSHNASKDMEPRPTTGPTANFSLSFCFLKAVVILFITLYSLISCHFGSYIKM